MQYVQMKAIFNDCPKDKRVLIKWENEWDECEYTGIVSSISLVSINFIDFRGRGQHIQALNFGWIKSLTYVEPSYILKLQKVHQSKSPTTRSNYVGIELEFISRYNAEKLRERILDAGLESVCELKTDGSVSPDDTHKHGHELCILATEKSIHKVVDKVAKLLSKGCKVNKSCGMHVHVDMRNRKKDEAFAKLFASQSLLYAMVPKARSNGTYSMPLKAEQYRPFKENAVSNSRYIGINTQAFFSHRTIEVRIHSGTVVGEKIKSWVALLLKIVNSKTVVPVDTAPSIPSTYKEVKKLFKIRGKLDKYCQMRLNSFKARNARTGFIESPIEETPVAAEVTV